MEKDERIEKLERENRALKSRCYALSSGCSLCCFCPLECVHRSCDFLKWKSEDKRWR